MSRRSRGTAARVALFAAVLALCAVLPAGAAGAGPQIGFGVRMAQRGLWSEALFRFQQAEHLDPGNARVFNNQAVALEALGRFEDALAAYQKGLKIDAANRDLKRNYSRFVEFYQGFQRKGEEKEAGEAVETTATEAEEAADVVGDRLLWRTPMTPGATIDGRDGGRGESTEAADRE